MVHVESDGDEGRMDVDGVHTDPEEAGGRELMDPRTRGEGTRMTFERDIRSASSLHPTRLHHLARGSALTSLSPLLHPLHTTRLPRPHPPPTLSPSTRPPRSRV